MSFVPSWVEGDVVLEVVVVIVVVVEVEGTFLTLRVMFASVIAFSSVSRRRATSLSISEPTLANKPETNTWRQSFHVQNNDNETNKASPTGFTRSASSVSTTSQQKYG